MRVLIIKLSSLGDVVQTMPVVADILAAYPHAQIDWVAEEAFAPLLLRLQGLAHVIPIALRRWRKRWLSAQTAQERAQFRSALQAHTYDAVIDCQGLLKSACVARLANRTPSAVCGSFANKSEACSYEWPVKYLLPNNQVMPKRIHAIARTRLLCGKLLGYIADDETKERVLQTPPQVVFKHLALATQRATQPSLSTSSILLVHGTTRADNEWALANWLALATQLTQHGQYQLLLPQSNEQELHFCRAIKDRFGSSAQILPTMDLPAMLDVMAHCAGVIGVDTGLSHMAVALALPHVQIFSHDRLWRAGPLAQAQGGLAHQLAVGGAVAPSAEQVWQAWLTVENAAKRLGQTAAPLVAPKATQLG